MTSLSSTMAGSAPQILKHDFFVSPTMETLLETEHGILASIAGVPNPRPWPTTRPWPIWNWDMWVAGQSTHVHTAQPVWAAAQWAIAHVCNSLLLRQVELHMCRAACCFRGPVPLSPTPPPAGLPSRKGWGPLSYGISQNEPGKTTAAGSDKVSLAILISLHANL